MPSTNNQNRKAVLIIIGAVALILGLIVAAMMSAPKGTAIASGTLLPQPRPLPAFTVTDQDGAEYTRDSMLGHWTVIFPGFTYCPDICPTTLGELKAVEAQLGGDAEKVRIMLFSVDPERDTPATLKRYLAFFSPSFIGVTTPEPQLKQMAQTFGFAYIKVEGETPDAYTMDHSAALILVNPQAQIAGYFTPPFDIDALSRDLRQIIQ